MSINELLNQLRYVKIEEQRHLLKKFLLNFIGKDKKYDYVGNKIRGELRKKVGEL